MRVAQVAPPWFTVPPGGYGGIEVVVSALADGLVERGHDVTLFASGGSATSARLVSPHPVPPLLAGPTWHHDEAYHVLSAYLRTDEMDVIHDHTWMGPLLGATRDGPPVVATLHGPWDPFTERTFGLLVGRVHVVAISNAQARTNPAIHYAGVVHNGIPVEQYPLVEKKDDFLLFVGRSCYEKGPDRAIDVARKAGMPLILAAKRLEPHEHAYWEQLVVPKLGSDVTVLEAPAKHALVHLMSRARAVVFPIDWEEPFGMVMVEAMACGTPVLAHPRGAAPEVIDHGQTGFLCSTLEEMADAVGSTVEISAGACRSRVEAHFSTEAMVKGYERVYRALTSKDVAPHPVAAVSDDLASTA